MPYPTLPISSATSSVVPKPAKGSKTICPFSVHLFIQYSTRLSAQRTSSWRNLGGRILLFPLGNCIQVCTASSGLIFRFALFERFNCSSSSPGPRLLTLCLRRLSCFLTFFRSEEHTSELQSQSN